MTRLLALGLLATTAVLGANALAPDAVVAQSLAGRSLMGVFEVGPTIRGRNYSEGLPPATRRVRDGEALDLPWPDAREGALHALIRPTGSLSGARRITLRVRVDAAPGAAFVARDNPGAPATVSLMIQRGGDRWSGRGAYDGFRWYAPVSAVRELRPGVHTLVAPLDRPVWTSVNGRPASATPSAFFDALAEAETVSVLFGSSARRGHGVFSTGPARVTILDLRVD